MNPTPKQITVEDLVITVVRKNIKNLNLSVHGPDGRVRVSAPRQTSEATIRQVVQERLEWIRRQQKRLANMAEPAAPHYASGEPVDYLGQTYPLNVIESAGRPKAVLHAGQLDLVVPPGSTAAMRQRILEAWYRAQLKLLIPQLIAHWEPVMGVQVAAWGVKRMKTKWGTCNIRARRIWLNLELVKLPPATLEYVVVHEMTHLLERLHNARFKALLDGFLPGWRTLRKSLKESVNSNGRLRMG